MTTKHQAIICTTDAVRIKVIDVEEHHGQGWVDCCRAAAFKYMRMNDLRLIASLPANGNMTFWVE